MKDELVPGNPSLLFLHAILAIFCDDECCGDGNRKAPIYLRPSLQKDAAAAYSMVATWLSKYGHLPCSESAIASIAWPHLPSSLSSSQQGPQLRRSNPLKGPPPPFQSEIGRPLCARPFSVSGPRVVPCVGSLIARPLGSGPLLPWRLCVCVARDSCGSLDRGSDGFRSSSPCNEAFWDTPVKDTECYI